MRLPSKFGHEYGASPLHLISALASFAVAGWAVLQVSTVGFLGDFLLWLVGAVVVHDLVLLPLYSLVDRAAARFTRPRETAQGVTGGAAVAGAPINYLRVPIVLSGLLMLLFFPLILGLAESDYAGSSGLGTDVYLGRWLLLSGALFVLSGAVYLVRRARSGRPSERPPGRARRRVGGPTNEGARK